MRVNLRNVIIIGVVAAVLLGGMFFYQILVFSDGKLHIIFCDVGQGDAIFIRTPKGNDILLDGGPGDSVLSCLADNMPFWDRSIELMLLSHPHEDHLAGLISVLERYTVLQFATERLANKTAGFAALQKAVENESLTLRYLFSGDTVKTKDGVTVWVLGPSQSFLTSTSPGGTIGEKEEFASLVLLVSYGSFDVMLTGDSQAEGLEEALTGLLSAIEVLQVPHHGSKTGLTSSLVGKINPQLAVISVGKNKYGHPSAQTLGILGDQVIRVLRTDKNGDVEIVSDGNGFAVRK